MKQFEMNADQWLADLRFHLKRGPTIVNKHLLRRVTNAIDTRDACRALSRMMAPKEVQFVPLPDGARVVLT